MLYLTWRLQYTRGVQYLKHNEITLLLYQNNIPGRYVILMAGHGAQNIGKTSERPGGQVGPPKDIKEQRLVLDWIPAFSSVAGCCVLVVVLTH